MVQLFRNMPFNQSAFPFDMAVKRLKTENTETSPLKLLIDAAEKVQNAPRSVTFTPTTSTPGLTNTPTATTSFNSLNMIQPSIQHQIPQQTPPPFQWQPQAPAINQNSNQIPYQPWNNQPGTSQQMFQNNMNPLPTTYTQQPQNFSQFAPTQQDPLNMLIQQLTEQLHQPSGTQTRQTHQQTQGSLTNCTPQLGNRVHGGSA